MVCRCLDKKSAGGAIKSEVMSNQQLVDELHKPITRQFKKQSLFNFLR